VVLVNDEADFGGIRWAVEDLTAALARAVASAFAGALCCDIDEVSGDIPGAKDWFGAGFGRIAQDDVVGEQVGQIVRALDSGALALAHSGDAAGYEDGLGSTLVAALRRIGQDGRDRCQDSVDPRRIVALAGMALTERD
jgi:hypothetical protein